MKRGRILISTAAAITSFATPSMAHYYSATFDCGGGQTVSIANPVEGTGADRKRVVILEIKIADFDFTKGPIRTPVVEFNPDHDDAVTLDGRPCRRARD